MSLRAASHPRASDRHGAAYDGHYGDRYDGRYDERPVRRGAVDAYDTYDHYEVASVKPRRAHAASPPRAARRDYTFGHAGRQVRIGPVAFWICVGSLVIMAAWSAVTATYFAFHDDVLARLIARQAAMQFAYEDRIAEMRTQVDRVTSRQLLDQEQFDRRLDQIMKRQSALEARSSSLGALADPSSTGSVRPTVHSAREPLKPSPMSDKATPPPLRGDRDAHINWRTIIPFADARSSETMRGGVEGEIARLQNSLDLLETRQTTALNKLEETYDQKLKRMHNVLADLGMPSAHGAEAPSGGPFVPYRLATGANAFDRQVQRVAFARAQADKLERTMAAMPIRQPVTGELDASSGYGMRIDPFLNRPAMHTGIDFRGDVGEAVRATASGTVTVAEWSGGYGQMVEVDHGNGLATRYGHLSQINVRVGQRIMIGQTVGRLGSTGRSTGPHLHYETRLHGEAVDPEKFLRAGVRMGID